MDASKYLPVIAVLVVITCIGDIVLLVSEVEPFMWSLQVSVFRLAACALVFFTFEEEMSRVVFNSSLIIVRVYFVSLLFL